MDNIKRNRFENVASSRVNKILNAMKSLQNCSNVYNYEYSEEDIRKMISTLRKQLDELKMAYDKGLAKNKEIFKF